MGNYTKTTKIVDYYKKNEEELLKSYESYVYDILNLECKVSKDIVSPFMCHIIFRYSYDTYFKSVVKKGKGDYPTKELLRWVSSNFKRLEMEFNNGDLNYRPIDMLEFILCEYDNHLVETFIETI